MRLLLEGEREKTWCMELSTHMICDDCESGSANGTCIIWYTKIVMCASGRKDTQLGGRRATHCLKTWHHRLPFALSLCELISEKLSSSKEETCRKLGRASCDSTEKLLTCAWELCNRKSATLCNGNSRLFSYAVPSLTRQLSHVSKREKFWTCSRNMWKKLYTRANSAPLSDGKKVALFPKQYWKSE